MSTLSPLYRLNDYLAGGNPLPFEEMVACTNDESLASLWSDEERARTPSPFAMVELLVRFGRLVDAVAATKATERATRMSSPKLGYAHKDMDGALAASDLEEFAFALEGWRDSVLDVLDTWRHYAREDGEDWSDIPLFRRAAAAIAKAVPPPTGAEVMAMLEKR